MKRLVTFVLVSFLLVGVPGCTARHSDPRQTAPFLGAWTLDRESNPDPSYTYLEFDESGRLVMGGIGLNGPDSGSWSWDAAENELVAKLYGSKTTHRYQVVKGVLTLEALDTFADGTVLDGIYNRAHPADLSFEEAKFRKGLFIKRGDVFHPVRRSEDSMWGGSRSRPEVTYVFTAVDEPVQEFDAKTDQLAYFGSGGAITDPDGYKRGRRSLLPLSRVWDTPFRTC